MKVSLIPAVTYLNEDELVGKNAVVIDVLRATSVMTTAIGNGASEIIPLTEIEEALKLKNATCILGGERKGLKIEGFDLANSPLEYTRDRVSGRRVAMTTTNGTKTINKALKADGIYIACMLNGRSVARKLSEDKRDIVIICSGTYGKFSLDDFICAGKIIYELKNFIDVQTDDMASAAYLAYRDNKDDVISYVSYAMHYNYLLSIGLEEDIKYCFKEDVMDVVPVYGDGKIKNCEPII